MNEAAARIKINRLLEAAGWRFFDDAGRPANIRLEASADLTPARPHALAPADLAALGNDFEQTQHGKIDFLLLNDRGFPLVVLEAKRESLDPLTGKEQARRYARAQNCRFVILSNGNLHYFWDLERGNPYQVTAFPTPDSVGDYKRVQPDPGRLTSEIVRRDYVALTQRPAYAAEAAWRSPAERPDFTHRHNLRFLRDYQLRAVHTLQRAVRDGADRFLFEMATGTGKTLVAAAVAKLFLRTGNARRVLFLVDRLELEEQARKALHTLLANDYKTVVYKENRGDWRSAEIVVSTVQSLLFDNKYQRLFAPTDFDLVVSDEAHRSIAGNARAVFEHFVGYKLGLTATPLDYLRGFDQANPASRDPRETERRLLRDTYRTFGCQSGDPTFRYTLIDGVRGGWLVNPTVVDARTDITARLLSDEGFVVPFTDADAADAAADAEGAEAFRKTDFEKRFYAGATNQVMCKTFLDHALRDPVSGEVGKSIVFAVSQAHAARLTQIFNQIAHRKFPGRYQSDFAVQVTSHVPDAQQFAIAFANNNLHGSGNVLPAYRTSKARVCVTVGMMTTGYDCTDILNLGLLRPIFSPTEFIQIKGRGTRTHDFHDQLFDAKHEANAAQPRKTAYKLFDFFASCEYFEEEFDYDQVIQLPLANLPSGGRKDGGPPARFTGVYEYHGPDVLADVREETIGIYGMRVDRAYYDRFAETVRADAFIANAVDLGQWDRVVDYVNRQVFDKPEEYYSLKKLRCAAAVDRRLTLREILEHVLGLVPRLKSKDELLEEEFAKFLADHKPPDIAAIPALKTYFKAYAANGYVRQAVDERKYASLADNPAFSISDFRQVPQKFHRLVPQYVRDYVSLNQFVG